MKNAFNIVPSCRQEVNESANFFPGVAAMGVMYGAMGPILCYGTNLANQLSVWSTAG